MISHNGIPSRKNHQAFYKYKNAFHNQSAIICGTGSSLNDYKPIDGIHIGCNRCLFYDKLIFDFYFFNDFCNTTPDYRNYILNYTPNISKFFGFFEAKPSFGSDDALAQKGKAILYDMEGPGGGTYQSEIHKYSVGDGGQSTVFVLMQFALFCGFSTIYIVGCDITTLKDTNIRNKYFYNAPFIKTYNWYAPLKHNWKKMKLFIEQNYPNTKIISVNPMGLKGLFTDEYQSN